MKNLLALSLIFALATIAGAQTYSFGDAAFRGQNDLFTSVAIHTQARKGNWSLSTSALFGIQTSGTPQTVIGFDELLAYNAGKGWSIGTGPAYMASTANYSPSAFSWNKVGWQITLSSPINWAVLFGGSSGTNPTPLAAHVIDDWRR